MYSRFFSVRHAGGGFMVVQPYSGKGQDLCKAACLPGGT
jgi:hypothetical protein